MDECNESLNKIIMKLFIDNPETRDDKLLLIYSIWKNEVPENYNMLQALLEGKLSHPESICRMFREIQEHNIFLRGKNYDKRQELAGIEKRKRNLIKDHLMYYKLFI